MFSSQKSIARSSQESFSGSEPCAGLTDLLSKTSLTSNEKGQASGDISQGSPGLSHGGGGAAGGGGASSFTYDSRMAGADRSFTYNEETPRSSRNLNEQSVRGEGSSRWEDWRPGGASSVPGGGEEANPRMGLDFSTPVPGERKRESGRAGAVEDDSFDAMIGGSSIAGGSGMRG